MSDKTEEHMSLYASISPTISLSCFIIYFFSDQGSYVFHIFTIHQGLTSSFLSGADSAPYSLLAMWLRFLTVRSAASGTKLTMTSSIWWSSTSLNLIFTSPNSPGEICFKKNKKQPMNIELTGFFIQLLVLLLYCFATLGLMLPT